eukprot:6573274-Lingulodinium_polyedra.AAC.1
MLSSCPRCPSSRVVSLDSVTSSVRCQRAGQKAKVRSWFCTPRQSALARPSTISWFLKTAGLVHPEIMDHIIER